MIQCIKKSICCLPAADYLPPGPGGHLERRWSQADTDGSSSSISIRLVWKRHEIASQGRAPVCPRGTAANSIDPELEGGGPVCILHQDPESENLTY